jgi:hypothetical protein
MITFLLGGLTGLLVSRTALATKAYNAIASKLTFLPR